LALNLCAGQTVAVGTNTYGSTGVYSDTLATSFGCDSIILTALTIDPLILGTITFSRDFCSDEAPVNFTALPLGGIWVDPGIDSTTGLFSPALAGAGTHTVIYIPNSPCPIPDSVTVQVFSTPVINFVATDELCDQNNGSIVLTIAGGTPAYIYNWSNGETTQNLVSLKKGAYSVIVTDVNNCTDSEDITLINEINSDCKYGIFVANIFSPDGNGENDVLYVQGSGVQTMEFIIFNRYGNRIFESKSTEVGWDGNYKGSPAKTGAFVYFVRGTFLNGDEFELKGTTTLIRR